MSVHFPTHSASRYTASSKAGEAAANAKPANSRGGVVAERVARKETGRQRTLNAVVNAIDNKTDQVQRAQRRSTVSPARAARAYSATARGHR